MAAVKPSEVRAAREFLRKRGVRGMSPRKFAMASMETDLSFQELLKSLGGLARRQNEHTAT